MNPSEIDAIRTALTAADYTTDAVLERLGSHGQSGLGRNTTVPADEALAGAMDAQATLIRLWLLQQPVPADALACFDEDAVAALHDQGLLTTTGALTRAEVDLRPYGSPDDGASGWVVSDVTPGLDHAVTPTRPDFVLGVSPASTTLAQITMRTPVASALDLGTGCGVQSLHLSRHAERVVGTDVNERALDCARLGTALSGADVDLRTGSLYEPVDADTFDLIVTNPPYVMSPPSGERLTYRETGFTGDALTEAVIRQAPAHLNPGGSLQVLTNWANIGDDAWEHRLRGWVEPGGCDAWIIERERLDVYSYIEMWLADAGLAGSPQWRSDYDRWLRYFEGLGITSVGMGWVLLTNAGRSRPHVSIESWPHAVHQPVGDAFARHAATVDALQMADADLLRRALRLRPDVTQEAIGEPGAADPSHIVLRSATGLRRAMQVDTFAAAVLGACDGELPLGVLAQTVGQLLDMPTDAVVDVVMPQVREAVWNQLLDAL